LFVSLNLFGERSLDQINLYQATTVGKAGVVAIRLVGINQFGSTCGRILVVALTRYPLKIHNDIPEMITKIVAQDRGHLQDRE